MSELTNNTVYVGDSEYESANEGDTEGESANVRREELASASVQQAVQSAVAALAISTVEEPTDTTPNTSNQQSPATPVATYRSNEPESQTSPSDNQDEVETKEAEASSTDDAPGAVSSNHGQLRPGAMSPVDEEPDPRNPAYVPRKGGFFQHDMRLDESASNSKTPSGRSNRNEPARGGKWKHDMYRDEDQIAKSADELIAQYGYDIRRQTNVPRRQKSRGKPGVFPGDARYLRPRQSRSQTGRQLPSTDEEVPQRVPVGRRRTAPRGIPHRRPPPRQSPENERLPLERTDSSDVDPKQHATFPREFRSRRYKDSGSNISPRDNSSISHRFNSSAGDNSFSISRSVSLPSQTGQKRAVGVTRPFVHQQASQETSQPRRGAHVDQETTKQSNAVVKRYSAQQRRTNSAPMQQQQPILQQQPPHPQNTDYYSQQADLMQQMASQLSYNFYPDQPPHGFIAPSIPPPSQQQQFTLPPPAPPADYTIGQFPLYYFPQNAMSVHQQIQSDASLST